MEEIWQGVHSTNRFSASRDALQAQRRSIYRMVYLILTSARTCSAPTTLSMGKDAPSQMSQDIVRYCSFLQYASIERVKSDLLCAISAITGGKMSCHRWHVLSHCYSLLFLTWGHAILQNAAIWDGRSYLSRKEAHVVLSLAINLFEKIVRATSIAESVLSSWQAAAAINQCSDGGRVLKSSPRAPMR